MERQRIAVSPESRRTFVESLGLRFRPLAIAWMRRLFRLRPGSASRRRLARRAVVTGCEAHNRGDLDATFMLLSDDCESTFPSEMGGLGSAFGTRGRAERIHFHRDFLAEWKELRLEPDELYDLEDGRMLVLGRMRGRGLSSGADFDNEWGLVLTFSRGEVTREQVFLDHAKARAEAGLSA